MGGVYQQCHRWLKAQIFGAMVQDLQELLRICHGRAPDSSATMVDYRSLQSTPESKHRVAYDGAKRREDPKVHITTDMPGYLMTLHVAPTNEQDFGRVEQVIRDIQRVTDDAVELACVDRGYTCEKPAAYTDREGNKLEVVRLPHAKRASCCFRAVGCWKGWGDSGGGGGTKNVWPRR